MRLLDEVRNLMGNYHVKSGIYHFYRNEFKQAVDFFRKAMKDEANLTESDRRMARHYLTQAFVESAERLAEKGDLDAATRDYARAVEVSPDFPDIRFRHGRILERLDRLDEAIEEYRAAVESNEDNEAARTALAFCLLRAGRDDEAAEAFSQVLALRVRQLREPYDRGLARLREGMTADEEFFRDAFLSDPHRFQEHYREALALLRADQFEKAQALFVQSRGKARMGEILVGLGILAEKDLRIALQWQLHNLHNAGRASTPMVNIVGANATYHQANFCEHELINGRLADLARPVSHCTQEARNASELGVLAAQAAQQARAGAGRICTLIAPTVCQWDPALAPPAPLSPPERLQVARETIEEVAALLANGKKTGLLLGSHALHGEGLELVDRIAARTGVALLGEMWVASLARGEGRVPVRLVPYLREHAAFFRRGTR